MREKERRRKKNDTDYETKTLSTLGTDPRVPGPPGPNKKYILLDIFWVFFYNWAPLLKKFRPPSPKILAYIAQPNPKKIKTHYPF